MKDGGNRRSESGRLKREGESLFRVHEQWEEPGCLKVGIICRRLCQTEALHNDETRAVGERERLIMKFGLPIPCLPERFLSNPHHLDDPRVLYEMENIFSTVADISCDKQRASLVNDVVGNNKTRLALQG